MTIPSRMAMAMAMGMTSVWAATLAPRSTNRICSVAYATDDNASEEKIGSARILGRREWSTRELGLLRPTRSRLTMVPNPARWSPPPTDIAGDPIEGNAPSGNLVRDARQHGTGFEQQQALHEQRRLVVQQEVPPLADDHLGHDHGGDGVLAGREPPDLLEHRRAEVTERRLHHVERDPVAGRSPRLLHRRRLARVEGEEHRPRLRRA